MAFANDCIEKAGISLAAVQSITIAQCVEGEVKVQLRDKDGNAIDITQYLPLTGSSSSSSSSSDCDACKDETKHGIELIVKEMPNSPGPLFRKFGEIKNGEDALNGIVHFKITTAESGCPGVWVAMAIGWDHGTQKLTMPFYYYITPNLHNYNYNGPLTISEIRLFMRDTAPEDNFLLDAIEYKDEEIMACLRAPIDYWNEIPPPVETFTPATFPYRYHWKQAVIGELLRIAATHMRRNDLDYQAAGVAVADTKKWPDYMKLSEARLEEWRSFVRNKKYELNIDGGFTSLGGFYAGLVGR